MEQTTWNGSFLQSVNRMPDAVAILKGSAKYPNIEGRASFWQTDKGVLVSVWARGLPRKGSETCDHPVFALHIHEGGSCTGNEEDPFADAKGHFNPEGCMHPAHAGDLPPLFSNKGEAWQAVLTDRFDVRSIYGRAVIIHRGPDDFTTQPSGASGEKIACGVIYPVMRR